MAEEEEAEWEEELDAEEEASERMIEEAIGRGVYHRCYCGSLLEKNGGCNYVQCARCKQAWCWVTKLPKGPGPGHCPYHGPHNCH